MDPWPKRNYSPPKEFGTAGKYIILRRYRTKNDGVIILEDDCFVSKDFYNNVQQTFEYYKDEPKVAGISLYSYVYNENAGMPFQPLHGGYNVHLALEVKSVIGASNLLITSRYHGLVSGLNQRIPSLCTSWNHKYDELIYEYNVQDSLLDTTNEIQFMSTLNNALAYPEKYRPSIQTIDQLKTKSISMWNEVLEVISS